MPKCKINGKDVEVPAGSTIIQAFKKLNEDICHYCYHDGLSIAGVCRLCMVKIEGMPKLQIACNTEVKDGMIVSNQTDEVKDVVRWGLDFHLINHPLDCPICDQAGECGLQDQYMQFGKYDPEMAERKVKKHKVVDLGPTVVLDTERCILCSRCVRFTDEVSKTNELGIFNRGDRSEIGTFEGKPLKNNYSLNTVDICPVGALTSKDFRFRQRVWYLKDADTICSGCSTGCNVKVYFNEEGLWRVKPRYNQEVNGWWMCDIGRDTYKFVNKKERLINARVGHFGTWSEATPITAAQTVGEALRKAAKATGSVALVLTGQYTNEEYESILSVFVKELGVKNVFHWLNNAQNVNDFDGILYRGDKNPNTTGLAAALKKFGVGEGWDAFKKKTYDYVVVAGPENQSVYPDIKEKLTAFSTAKNLIWLTAGRNPIFDEATTNTWQIPLKTYVEKAGTFVNFNGLQQKFNMVTTIVPQALTLSEVAEVFAGRTIDLTHRPAQLGGVKKNYYTALRGAL